jgi:hypothetical protein
VDEFQQALLIFAVGAVVTAFTAGMILKGHLSWQGRDPWGED